MYKAFCRTSSVLKMTWAEGWKLWATQLFLVIHGSQVMGTEAWSTSRSTGHWFGRGGGWSVSTLVWRSLRWWWVFWAFFEYKVTMLMFTNCLAFVSPFHFFTTAGKSWTSKTDNILYRFGYFPEKLQFFFENSVIFLWFLWFDFQRYLICWCTSEISFWCPWPSLRT